MNYHQLLARKERCHRCQIYSEGFTITFDDDSLDRVVVVSHAKYELNNLKEYFRKISEVVIWKLEGTDHL